VSACERELPDCVLMDVRMPGLDGPSACEKIRALPHGQELPILFLTAQRDVDTFDRALQAGGDDFLTKPVQPSELVLRVQGLLKLRNLKLELREHYDLVRRQRDDLMRLQLQKERLSQFIVHDLKSPLGTLDLCAQTLLRDSEMPERSKLTVRRMRDEVRILLHMLLNLLDISRSDEGALNPPQKSVPLSALFEQVVKDLDLKAQALSVRLVPMSHALTAVGDADLLVRVLENLVENALRHAPENTEVRISAACTADDMIEIRVTDQGVGIAPDARATIFEPFVQLKHGERLVARSGRGLGLTFCKVAVEAQGGRIWIEDANPGASFCLTLPRAST
jgi:signal transduction histidine kinase